MKDITEIIGELLDSLNFQFEAKTVAPLGSDFLLTTCNTYWLRPKKTVTIAAKKYKIKSIVINESVTLTPIGHIIAPTIGFIFDIPKPVYRHGTAKAINAELTKFKQSDKTPFTWLFELLEEEINVDEDNTIGITAPIRLFLFDEANPEDMLTENHYSDVIRPLKQLAKEIVKKINSTQNKFKEVSIYKTTSLPDWGEFNSPKGFDSKIFDENWSGLQLSLTIEVYKDALNCDC